MQAFTPEQRETLRQKRQQARQELTDEQILATRQPLFHRLDERRIPYEVIIWQTQKDGHSTDPAQLWLEERFTFHIGGRIDWNVANDVHQRHETAFEFDHGQFLALMAADHQLKNPLVTVVWANFLSPTLKIRLDDLIPVASDVVTQDHWDCWIFDDADNWCVEYHHDGTLTFGRSLPKK